MPRAVVTGGAGFLGSHISRALLGAGFEVVAVDNLSTGRRENAAELIVEPGFTFIEHDVSTGLDLDGLRLGDGIDVAAVDGGGAIDAVLHFASPASPPAYLARPLETLAVGSEGTRHALELARTHGARFLLASTSEIYGDPMVHPQTEDYLGNVSSVGPRSVYDEAKRFAEAITMAYHREFGLDTKIVRIFNTYGPRMALGDGRVVTNFLEQALAGAPLTIYGDGSQTRSFCWVDDEVRGILALLASEWVGPMNIGNPDEFTVLELAKLVLEVTGSNGEIVFEALPVDDPTRRRPDISLARHELGWQPEIDLRTGLERLAAWYRSA